MHMYSATPMAAHLLMLPTGARSMSFDSLSRPPTGPTSPAQADDPPPTARFRSANLDASAPVPPRTHSLPHKDATRAAAPPPLNAGDSLPGPRPSTQPGPRPNIRPAVRASEGSAGGAWARALRPPTAGRPSMTWRY
jgi:hypothetical protein